MKAEPATCTKSKLALALSIVALSLVPFSIMYGYSVVVIPIQSVLAPHNPYALKNSHAVWALSGSLVMSGVAQYLGGGATRRAPKSALLVSAVGGAIGLILQGVAMDLAEHHRHAAIALYYVGQVAFFGPVCGATFLLALIASLGWLGKLYPHRPGLGSGAVGPFLALETAVTVWVFWALNDRVGRGALCEKPCTEGRVDVFFYVAAAAVLACLLGAAALWDLPAAPAPAKETPRARTSLTVGGIARTRTFWSYFFVYLITLTPGFGLKLMSSPVVYFTYGFSDAAAGAFTCFYLACYGAGRFVSPLLSRGNFDRARRIYLAFSLLSAALLLVSPATVDGLPSKRWPAPLPFCLEVGAQGFFLGGFKGLMPAWLGGLWRWMDGDPKYASYDSLQAYSLTIGMTNCALCVAAALGPATAWIAYVVSPDVSQADLDSGRATGKDYQIWYYAAGAMQVIASAVLATPGAVPRFLPKLAATADGP